MNTRCFRVYFSGWIFVSVIVIEADCCLIFPPLPLPPAVGAAQVHNHSRTLKTINKQFILLHFGCKAFSIMFERVVLSKWNVL